MRKDLTEIVFILDRSGSMTGLEDDTIGGFNSLIAKQKREPGEALVSAVLFDDRQEVLYSRTPIRKVRKMTDKQYYTRGSTALLDAVGGAIDYVIRARRREDPDEQPMKTLFVITTDGMENSSREYTYSEIKRMIRYQRDRYGWEFLFLGANIDAAREADKIGIGASRAVNYHSDRKGTRLNYTVVSKAVSEVRTASCPPAMALPSNWADDIRRDYSSRQRER